MARQRKKPDYPHELGAYSKTPRVREAANGEYVAEGEIDSWRGSLEDLRRAGEAGFDALSEERTDPVTVTVSCTDSRGHHRQYESLDSFVTSAEQLAHDELNSVRIEIRQEGSGASGWIVARRLVPGVLISASGRSRIEVDGLARLLFSRLMPGYIDRYAGSWRWMAAAAITMVPAALTYAIAADRWDHWPHVLVVLFAIAGTLATLWVMTHSWQWTLYRTPLEFVPDEAPLKPDRRGQVERFLRKSWATKAIALLGLLLVGIVTNKLSDLIPWP